MPTPPGRDPFEQALRDFEEAAQHFSIATPPSDKLRALCHRAEAITRELFPGKFSRSKPGRNEADYDLKSAKFTPQAVALQVRAAQEIIDALSNCPAEPGFAQLGAEIHKYARDIAVPQARRELAAAREQIVALTPDEQLAFWQALHRPPNLTSAQVRLGAVMRGDS